ncbi:MAG: phage tail sheath family protein [Bacteroidia bacterium]|nr:phage tail sheath family protein [Bacteroidia bacterium]
MQLSATERKTVYDQMLAQCNKLQDRFAILDAATGGATVVDDADTFRTTVGAGNLKYGAAYYPNLKTDIFRYVQEGSVMVEDNRPTPGNGPFHGYSLDNVSNAGDLAIGQIVITDNDVVDGDTFTVDTDDFVEGTDFDKGVDATATAAALAQAISAIANPGYTVAQVGPVITLTATAGAPAIALDYNDSGTGDAAALSGNNLEVVNPEKALYNKIVEMLQVYKMELYPCGSVAGIYARVDRERGVWKAPANVDVRGVSAPVVLVTTEEQNTLNVHPGTGKSINVIRKFAGKGNLVWGSRTLAGNDNEWRYVPVRRLYIFVEESVKKATEHVVFEPNDANTWLRVKTMIENFLAKLWRDGALAGAKAEDAFFVKVGLGQTMTALDILEGIMNIEIGMAAVRPAEFIILKFSHKLQES